MRKYTITSPVSTEPITLAEVKEYLKLDSGAFIDDITTTQNIAPASRTPATVTSSSVDINRQIAIVNLSVGTCTGTLNVSIQHSDDESDWDEFDSFTEVTEGNQVQTKEYTGTKRYIRIVAVLTDDNCEYGVSTIVKTSTTSEDAILTSYITSARQYGEYVTGHKFAPQTINYFLTRFPDVIEWAFPPLTSLTSIKYKNSDGDETTLTEGDDYIVDVDTFPGTITTPYNILWDTFVPYPLNPITITGVCGYTGTAPYVLPENYKQAMLFHIGLMYRNRDTVIMQEEMAAVHRLYNTDRAWWF